MISAIILTHNSELTIKRTIDSVCWCKEIIVIDDVSTDKTAQVAKSAGGTVIINKNGDDFAKKRNFALGKARGPWALFVDSDEEVPKELRREIEARAGKEEGVNGYYCKRTDILFGKKLLFGETSRVRLLRLAKKENSYWVRPVHEMWRVSGATGEFKTPLLHYSHNNVAQFLQKINYYSTLNAKYLYRKNVRIAWWHIPVYPGVKFIKNYLMYLGFRDGTEGAICAIMMSFHSFLTRAKLWHLWDQEKV